MQRRVLIRTRGLASFRQSLVDLAAVGGPLAARRRVIVVPTRAAGALLRLTIEQQAVARGAGALVCPDLLTRDEWLQRLLPALEGSPRWLGRIERLVLLERAVHTTLERRPGLAKPFDLRPGLLAAMLDFHDELRRRQRKVRTFARTIFDDLRVERGTDRGSESLIDQTRFLGFVFLAYERAARASGGVDEHELTRRLLVEQPPLPFDHLVVAVADHPADPRGLWPADFDLIGRLRMLSNLDIVMTDEAHDAGFRARVEQELPGIEEVRAADVPRSPVLVAPVAGVPREQDVPVVVSRDREEELREATRCLRARAAQHGGVLTGATAIVFHRPLPYLYLAHQVLTDARVPYQTFDALPLAVEPYAALLDLALAVSRTDGARDAVLALLRSPLAAFEVDDVAVTAGDVQDLDLLLVERRVSGSAATFEAEVNAWASGAGGRRAARAAHLRRAARAAADVTRALRDCRTGPAASAQVRCLAACLRMIERHTAPVGTFQERFRRARAAVLGVLDALAEAFARHDDRPRTHDDLAAAIYHAIEDQTFAPGRGHGGVHLVDAAAARFGEFDDVLLVGLVETDWAERQRRNFFYSAGLLKALGWPQDVDQTLAQQAAFRDVLTLARCRTRLSAFQLDGETVVALSTMIEAARGLAVAVETLPDIGALFADEILTRDGVAVPADAEASAWLAGRRARPELDEPAYSGFVPPPVPGLYRVSRVDRYVTCPFKYFAAHVLNLTEERSEGAGLTPLERGTLLHLLFERFYGRWQELGHGAITDANIPAAHALFADIATDLFEDLPPPDREVERLRLLGSVVAPGVASRVFELEAAAPGLVVERRLEVAIEGPFTFPVSGGLTTRTIAIKGKADRVDVLDDGSLRVIDYKLGRMPDLSSSVQVGVYAHCVRQAAEAADGRSHPVSSASYLAFGDEYRLEGRLGSSPAEVGNAVEARAGAFASVVERIERGEFPPRPLRTSECQWCGFSGVCRKEYRIEDDDPAESV
jgi:RecB family exonuclease